MKHIISFLLLLAVLMSGCTKEENMGNEPTVTKGRVFTSSFENNESRTYVENGTSSRWTAADTISLFDSNTLNLQYKFTGKTGDAGGSFVYKSKPAGEGTPLAANYAVYPYDKDMTISEEGVITLTLPSVQHYAENSYGLGANTMVAVTENTDDTSLMFKNVGACIQVRLYADEETMVKSITLTGNNEEKIAGSATISASYNQAPVLTMADDATTSITLECGEEGVPLSNSSGEPTVFWMVVPPVTFAEGYTLTVKDVADKVFTRTTESEVILKRNGGRKTMPVKVVPQEVAPIFGMREALVKLYESTGGDSWTNKDNWCSDKPLTEWHGVSLSNGKYSVNLPNNGLTGEISQIFPDSLVSLKVEDNQLTSVNVSGCASLDTLYCYDNQLTSLDVTGCTSLEVLGCEYNNLGSLDVADCVELKVLYCGFNSLGSLDASNCTSLEYLDATINELTSLNVSGCTALKILACQNNKLTTLDVSTCTALQSLDCITNLLTSLDVSNCTSLKRLACLNNQLTSLSVPNTLEYLWCENNSLSTLDLSPCKALTGLSCSTNQLTSLDVTGCTALTNLNCSTNQLTILDVSTCTALQILNCSTNQLTSLNVSNCEALLSLNCQNNKLTTLDVSNNIYNMSVKCDDNVEVIR